MWQYIETILTAPVVHVFTLTEPFSIYSLIGALATAFAWYVLRRRGSFARRTRAFARVAFSRHLWAHRSSVLDLKLFFFATFFNALGILGIFAVSLSASASTQWLLGHAIAPAPQAAAASITITVVMSVLYWVMFDLGYWFAHWLMHRIPVLWEFHKLHHSAEVLTPLTEFRQHPVELLLFPFCTGAAIGMLYGASEHLLGVDKQALSLVWVNVLLLGYSMTLLHLRHSHVWIPVTGWLGYIIQSPAHHQIHHSTDPKHFNKNLGFGLSLWDWAFRTLYIPEKREVLEFGIGPEGLEHDGVLNAVWRPFVKAGATTWSAVRPRRTADQSPAGVPAE